MCTVLCTCSRAHTNTVYLYCLLIYTVCSSIDRVCVCVCHIIIHSVTSSYILCTCSRALTFASFCHIYMYIYMHVCIYIYIYDIYIWQNYTHTLTHTHTHTYTHTHTHTHTHHTPGWSRRRRASANGLTALFVCGSVMASLCKY